MNDDAAKVQRSKGSQPAQRRTGHDGRPAPGESSTRVFLVTGTDEGTMRMTAQLLASVEPDPSMPDSGTDGLSNSAHGITASGMAGEACRDGGNSVQRAGTLDQRKGRCARTRRRVIAYTIRSDREGGLGVVRTISHGDPWSVAGPAPATVPLDGCCLTCTVKRDIGRILEADPAMGDALVVLPAGMEASPVARYLDETCMLGEALGVGSCRVASTVVVERVAGFRRRLFDDRWFDVCEDAEDPDAESPDAESLNTEGQDVESSDAKDPDPAVRDDERCWGQVMAGLLAEADHVVLLPSAAADEPAPLGAAAGESVSLRTDRLDTVADVVEVMTPVGAAVHRDLAHLELDMLDHRVRHAPWCESEASDRRREEGPRMADADDGHDVIVTTRLAPGIVAMSVRSSRPVHPGRLSAFLAADCEPLHIRGHFIVPNKPFSVFDWQADPRGSEIAIVDDGSGDGADDGDYSTDEPRDLECGRDSRQERHESAHAASEFLVVASSDGEHEHWPAVCETIRGILLTDEEMARPASFWLDQRDAFTTWMALSQHGTER